MNISAVITDMKHGMSEEVSLEEWVHGNDTFLLIAPATLPNIKMRFAEGALVLEYADAAGSRHTVLLSRQAEAQNELDRS